MDHLRKTLKFVRPVIFFILLAAAPMAANAQSDIDLAEYYFNNGEFEQARLYYDKIWKTDKTNRVYEKYVSTLVALRDFEAAEDMVKRKLKAKGDKSEAYVDLGSLYLQFDRQADAEKEFNNAIKELTSGRSNAIRLANAFIKLNRYDFALATYEKAQRSSGDEYPYLFEIANVQGMMGNLDLMVDSFLDLLRVSPNYIQTVQNSLSRTMNPVENTESAEQLRVKLLRQAQKFPEEAIYSEMLIWLFNQQKEFASAVVHAQSLDRRFSENGLRLMEIGAMARRNEDWDAAYDAFAYVVGKGSAQPYYVSARNEMLRARLESLSARSVNNPGAFEQLATEYEEAITDLGRNAETAGMMLELAKVYAFHIRESEKAIKLLDEAIELPGVYESLQAKCKLALGDILLLEGEVWEASLLFSQVELAFKEDVLGSEAKFRNARISYYTGDFDWAQAQLDVLKASTSKLISNDAIALSLLITDNYNMDTTTVPMELYARAELLAYQNRWDQASMRIDSLLTSFPGHTLTDEAFLLSAKNHLKRGEYPEATGFLDKILELHFFDILADDALFILAELAQTIGNDEAKAMELYQKLMTDYPGSLYVVEARKRYRQLRGDSVQ